MELISANFYFVECRDKQDIRITPTVNQDSLHIEVGNGSRDDQGVVVEKMQASQVVVGESDGLMSSSRRRGEVANFFLISPIITPGMSLPI